MNLRRRSQIGTLCSPFPAVSRDSLSSGPAPSWLSACRSVRCSDGRPGPWVAAGNGATLAARSPLRPASSRWTRTRNALRLVWGTPKSAKSVLIANGSYRSCSRSVSSRAADMAVWLSGWRTLRVRNATTFSTTTVLGSSSAATFATTSTSRFRSSLLPASASLASPRSLRAELMPWQGGQADRSAGRADFIDLRYSSTTRGHVLRRSPAMALAFGWFRAATSRRRSCSSASTWKRNPARA
jgi:hypothetical protein